MKHIGKHAQIVVAFVLILTMLLPLVACNEETPVPNYTVSFDTGDGTAISVQKVPVGACATEPTSPTRDGYTFAAWTLGGVDYDFTTPVRGDITLVARWIESGPFTVTFRDLDGTILKTETVERAGAATAPDAPSRPGYTFTGWDRPFDFITEDLTVTATYEQLGTFTVTFLDHNQTELKVETVYAGGSAAAPADPTRENHTFIGWDKAFNNVTENITVTAQYRENDKFSVQFVDHDGSVLKTESVYVGGSATAPADPTRENHTFIGWDKAFNNVAENITVTAQYRENDKFSVQFVDHDGSVLKTESVYVGGSATAPADPTRENHTFIGWDKAFNNVTENITVTATYSENEKFTVTFRDYDNTELDRKEVYTGTAVGAIVDPVRNGFTFTGWTLNGEIYDFFTPVTDDIDLIASYAKSAYVATYLDDNNNIIKVDSVPAGSSSIPPSAPYKAHYAFVTWETTDGSIASGAITYRASYAPIRHVVTFQHANGTGATTPITVNDCATVTAETAPVYDGFTFLYWTTEAGEHYDFSTRITKDTVLVAKYERNATVPAATSGNIVISPGYLEFWMGLELRLNIQANVTYTESATKVTAATTDVHYEGMTYTFYTDNNDIITITADGTITPVSIGTARVWAVIHTGGTQTHTSADYTNYDTFTVADGTVLSPIEIRIIEKPDYLQLYESDAENQKIQLDSSRDAIDVNDFLSKPTGEYGSANIAMWYNDATAVMTITIDDNIVSDFNQWTEWSQTYDVPMSVFAITRDYQKYVNRWADMTTLGNEVQPHGHNHHSATFYKSGYLTSAQAWHDSYVSKQVIEAANGERVLVFSYPCGYNAFFNDILYIGGRGVSSLPIKPEKINYNSVDLQNFPDADTIRAFFDPSVTASHYKYGGWFNYLQHSIGTDKSKYEAFLPLAKDYIDSGELWAALFSQACQYGQERDTATLSVTSAGANVITFTLTDKMNDLLFDHALTVKIKADNTWTHARAYQNGKECETRIVTEGGETYIYVNAVPDQGEVQVIRTNIEGLSETAGRIAFTPTDIGGMDTNEMTLKFIVDAATWMNAYAVQDGNILPTSVSTRGGKTTMTVTCMVNGGEVVIVPVTNQYDARESLTMYEVWQGLVTPDGTKPVLISTADDLVMFSEYVRNHGITAGITFRLTDDINMAGVTDFRPIGWQTDPSSNGDQSAKSPFSGIFDGAEHAIYNLSVKNTHVTYIGLFGYAENATITRLTVIGEIEGLGRVGGIVGRMVGGTMNGVTFEGSVTSYGDRGFEWTGSRVGGLVGQIDSATVKNCAAYASVVAYATGANGYQINSENKDINCGDRVGGIVGEIHYAHNATTRTYFDNIVFEGTVTAHAAANGTGANLVGGFIGRAAFADVFNITIKATVTGNTQVGGVFGYLTHQNFIASTVKNCAVSGTVTGNDYVAGFAGNIDANNTQKLYNCISTVVVNAPDTAEHVGALYGACPYGGQNTTSNNIFYIDALNPGMAPHPGTVKEPTRYCIATASVEDAMTALNTYATNNALPAWRLVDGTPSASYFPVFTVTILDKDGNVIEEQAVGNSLNVVLPETPFITGFEFVEWSGNTTNITSPGTIQMVYRAVETYTVTFRNKDGITLSTQTINVGRGATAPEATVYERFWFTGWDKAFDNITEDTVVTARYTDAYYVTFTYKAADGTTTTTDVKTASGTAAVAPSVPAVDGFTFSGWDTDFSNVTSDFTVTAEYITVTAGPITLNILQWTLTSAPDETFFDMLTGDEIILYTGSADISKVTLPTGWEAQCNNNAGQDASLLYSAVIYHTEKYRFDSVAGAFSMSLSSAATNAYVFAVPLLNNTTNQQVVAGCLNFGTWAATNAFGTWGKTEKSLKLFLADMAEQYASASGIVIGLRAQTKDDDSGALNNYTICDDTTAYVTGYDLMGHYELTSGTGAEYVLTFMRDDTTATFGTASVVDPTEGVSTNPGVRYDITFSEDNAE